MESYGFQAFGQFSGVCQFHFFSSVHRLAVPTPGFCELALGSCFLRDEAMFSELMPRAIDCAIAKDWAVPFHLHAVPGLYHAGAVFSLLQWLQLWLA